MMPAGEATGRSPLRVLIIEDSEDDVLLLLRELGSLGYDPVHAVADSAARVNAALDAGPWDIILSDYAMPQFTGLDALALVQRRGTDIPFILVSGALGEDAAVGALKAGVHDYLLKGNLKRLGAAIERERRDAHARLERAALELRYRSLFGSMTEGVAVCRLLFEGGSAVDFDYLDVNPAFAGHTGLADVTGRKVSEVIPGIHRSDPAVLELYARVCATGRPERGELHLASLDRWFDVSAYRLLPDQFVAVFSNVNERRLAAQKLQESKEFLDSIIDSIADPVFVKNREHRLVLVNQALCRLLGRPREDILGKTDVDLFPPEQAEVFWKHDEMVFASGREDVNEELVATASGEVRTIVAKKARCVAGSGEAYLVGVIRDITERKRVEQERSKFALGLERSTDAIFLTGTDGTINYVNPAFERTYGYAKGEALGKTPRILKSGEQTPAFYEGLWGSLLSKQVVRTEMVNRTKHGKLLHIDTCVNPVINEGGELLGFLAIHRDVTELKKLQEQLLLSERMTSMGMLAAGIAHEINNPLAAVMANLDFALETLTPEPHGALASTAHVDEALEALTESRDAAERVRQIVRDMKVFSRPDESRRVIVDLAHILESSVRMVWNELRHRAQLVKDFQPSPGVLANDARLGQVFVNLLVNAAQAIPEGSAERNTITLRTTSEGPTLAVVEVEDTGAGIAPEVLGKIFDPFFSTKPFGVGTGLGLAICRRIVAEFGGEITARSTVGQGTCFRVVLPAASDEVEPSEPVTKDVHSERRASILVVDDDPGVLKAMVRMLGRLHRVVALNSARDALERIAAGEEFDLVVSDLMMPDMSGTDLYDALQRISPQHAKRMVFLTGGAFTPRAQRFLEEVDNHRLEKPFDAASLLALVSRSLEP